MSQKAHGHFAVPLTRGLITQVLIRSSSLPASSFSASSFSFLVMVMCKHLPPQKVPPPGHVALPLPPKLLAWSEAHPDDWPRYEEYANNCTTTQQLEALFKHLEYWSNTRPREGELKAVVEQYSSFLDKAEEEVKDMRPGADRSARS